MGAKGLASVFLRDLIADADAARAPYDTYDVREAFKRLSRRDSSLGGGPLTESEREALARVRTVSTLQKLVADAERDHQPEHRKRYVRLALIETEDRHLLVLVSPTESRH